MNRKRLLNFLDEYKVEGNEKPLSHVSMGGGKWSIPLDKNEEFLGYYLQALLEGVQPLRICECFLPGKKVKLVMDVEIRPDHISGDVSFNKIENEILPKIINTIIELLKEKLSIENPEYIISSRAPYLYHINFPDIIVGIKTAKNLTISCRGIMERHYQTINWDKSIDTEIYSYGKGLRMLGSYPHHKKVILENEHSVYRVLKNNIPGQYLDIDFDQLVKTSIRTDIDDDQVLDISYHQEELVRHEEEIDNHDDIISAYIDEIQPQFKTLGLQISKIKKFYYGNIDYPCFSVNLKARLCPFVNREHKRSSDYLYIFITKNGASLRCHNEECKGQKFPSKIIKLNTTVKKKYYQLLENSNQEPEEIPDSYQLSEEIKTLIEKCLIEITHYDIAMLIYTIYKDQFRVDTFSASGTRTTWYEFKNHRFHADSNHLGILISEDLIYYFKKYKMDVCGGNSEVIDDLVKKLKTVSFKNSVLIEASNIFYDRHPEFLSLMDNKKNLICFNNGVYDLETLDFRDGKIEDYITLCTRNKYLEYDPEHPKSKEIMKFFEEVFTNKESREYILKKIALSLNGRGQEEFHIWTGNGCFAKDTEVLMYDGSVKKIQDVKIGDRLMGDDNTPRNVSRLFRGYSDMYTIIPSKGESFTINGDHDLALVASNTISAYDQNGKLNLKWYEYGIGYSKAPNSKNKHSHFIRKIRTFTSEDERTFYKKVLETYDHVVNKGDRCVINMRDYLGFSKEFQNLWNIYRSEGVDYPYREVIVDAYNLGYWIGKEKYLIPREYQINCKEIRYQLLAGILDASGYYDKRYKKYEISFSSEMLIDNIVNVCRSLGLSCYKYRNRFNGQYRIQIAGKNLEFIPCKDENKKPERGSGNKNSLILHFKIQKIADDNFYGFQLDKNNLFVLANNYTIQANSNGKSCICTLIKLAFGDYWNEMPVALITKPRNSSSSPSPEVMDLKGRRISTIQEPEMKDRLNMGLVKQFTGNDTISARQLHKRQEKFVLQTHLFLCCNVIPKIECSDGGTWRRIKIVEFKSKFVDSPDPKKDHEFKKDPNLDKKMASWGPYFLSLLVHYYKKALLEGSKEPTEVKEFTQEFRKDSDFFAQFVDDCLLDDGTSITCFNEIFNLFENWCIDNNIRSKLYTKTEIKKLLKDLFGSEKVYKMDSEYIKGFKVAVKKSPDILSDS